MRIPEIYLKIHIFSKLIPKLFDMKSVIKTLIEIIVLHKLNKS